MIVFKIIIGIIGAYLLIKLLTLDNTDKAYDYFYSAMILFAIILLVHPVV